MEKKQQLNRMHRMNHWSAVLFIISSLSILTIPLLPLDAGLPVSVYIVAAVFWAGLAGGIVLQLVLSRQCKKNQLHAKTKAMVILLILSCLFIISLLLLILFRSKSIIAVTGCIFGAIVSLQSAVIVHRERCLK